MWLTEDVLKKLYAWTQTGVGNKTVDIKMNWKGLEVYVYSFKHREGMHIDKDTLIENIDSTLKLRADSEAERLYYELRDRFEYNKEGD